MLRSRTRKRKFKIPVEFIETPVLEFVAVDRKQESIKGAIKRIVAFALIVLLNWSGLSAVIPTNTYMSDLETSQENSYIAGTLDFEPQPVENFPEVCSGEPATMTISIVNFANPFKYVASSTGFSGDACNYVILEASLDGVLKYTGPLTGFNVGPQDFAGLDEWEFKTTFSPDLPSELLGQTCNFDFVFDGSQTRNDLPFGEGFSDIEKVPSSFLAKACCWTEIRSCGYWKQHPRAYEELLPQILGGYPADIIVDTMTKANNILVASCGTCGCGCDNTMRGKLKGQLLAMKFNIAAFGIGDYIDASTTPKTLNEIVSDADNLLRAHPAPPDSVLEQMKNLLEHLNTLEKIPFCPETPPQCKLQLTKIASVAEITQGENIIYHLTFDNIGGKVCTGGGVKLIDEFGSSLQYVDYTSTRVPQDFGVEGGYLGWNFGSIYPDDPIIEIDLTMKVKNAQCDSVITNKAKYWSDQTDWGDFVEATTTVVCKIETGVLINEFLPNPVGNDGAQKPGGEWVELYNNTGSDVDVAGWWLYDEQNTHEVAITNANTNTGNTIVANNGFLVVYRNGDSDFALDNTGGDEVRLFNAPIGSGGVLMDSYAYFGNAPEGKSFARVPDGSTNWIDPIPTPGEENVLEGEEIIFGEAISEPDELIEDGAEAENVEFNVIPPDTTIIIGEPMVNNDAATTEEVIVAEEAAATTTEENATTTEEFATTTEEVATTTEEVATTSEEIIIIPETPTEESPAETTEPVVEQPPVIEEQPVVAPENVVVDNPSPGDEPTPVDSIQPPAGE